MPLLMIRNDLSKVSADAIVLPANEKLKVGSGTSEALYRAAGRTKLEKALEKRGGCEVGHAVLTQAFDLDAKFIIHAVGPCWRGGTSGEEVELYKAYQSSLMLAIAYNCESIAFPLLSTGNYGYPKEQAMQVALAAISSFLMEHELLVYLVLYDRDSVYISKKLFADVREYIDDNYVEINEQASYRIGRRNDQEKIMLSSEMEFSLDSLEERINQLEETFSQLLLRLIDERNLKDSFVYKKANIDRRHFSKIRNDINYTPAKKTVIAFAIALELCVDDASDLLRKAGFAFSNSSKTDVIIRFFMEQGNYDVFQINEVLYAFDLPCLGE